MLDMFVFMFLFLTFIFIAVCCIFDAYTRLFIFYYCCTLIYNTILISIGGTTGYAWGVDAVTLQTDLTTSIGQPVLVTLNEYSGVQNTPKYIYTIKIADSVQVSSSHGYGAYPLFVALTDKQISAPHYSSSNTSFLQPKYTLNDMSTSGKEDIFFSFLFLSYFFCY